MFKNFKDWLLGLKNEGTENIPDETRRDFLKIGLIITEFLQEGAFFL